MLPGYISTIAFLQHGHNSYSWEQNCSGGGVQVHLFCAASRTWSHVLHDCVHANRQKTRYTQFVCQCWLTLPAIHESSPTTKNSSLGHHLFESSLWSTL